MTRVRLRFSVCLLNRREDMAGKTWVFSFPSPSILDNILCPSGVQQLTPNKCPRNGRHSSDADLEVLWLWTLQGKILEGIYRLMSLTSSFCHSPCSCGHRRLPPLLAHRLTRCEEEPREVVLGPPTHCLHSQYRNLSTEEAGRQRQVLFIYI